MDDVDTYYLYNIIIYNGIAAVGTIPCTYTNLNVEVYNKTNTKYAVCVKIRGNKHLKHNVP